MEDLLDFLHNLAALLVALDLLTKLAEVDLVTFSVACCGFGGDLLRRIWVAAARTCGPVDVAHVAWELVDVSEMANLAGLGGTGCIDM